MAASATPLTGRPDLDTAITATGFRASLDPSFRVADIKGHLQHRHDPALNAQARRRYTNMFKAGSTPPPVGVTRDGRVIWGNHRIGGAQDAGWETIPAVVLDIDADGATEHVRDQLLSLAVQENAPHGVPYNNQDRIDRAGSLLNLGFTHRSIQATLGLTAAQVSGVKREMDALQRLNALGLEEKEFSRGVLRSFSNPSARALNDLPFKELVDITAAAGLTGDEVQELSKEAKAAGSDSDAMVVLKGFRSDNAGRIAEVAQGGVQRPTPVGKLKSALKAVLSLCEGKATPVTYRDHSSGVVLTATMLEDSIRCLQGILDIQEIPEDTEED